MIPGPRGRATPQRVDPLDDDDHRRGQHQHRAEDRGHRLGSPQPEGEARRRPPHGEAHREEAHAQREDVHQQVERVGLEDDAAGEDRAARARHEERDDDREDHAEAPRLAGFFGSEAERRSEVGAVRPSGGPPWP